MKRKKKKVLYSLQLPLETIKFYKCIAEKTDLTVSKVVSVVLHIEIERQRRELKNGNA